MKIKPINVFILDDEFPKTAKFREEGIYNTAISKDNLYTLAVDNDWNDLIDLQQLIKDVITSEECIKGDIDLFGFNSPTQALTSIRKGLSPDIIIYDWEYTNAPAYSQNAQIWLLEMLEITSAFIFVYSKRAEDIQKILNEKKFYNFINRFQLFLKGHKIKSSFSSEEFILQYIISTATNSGNIKINGLTIKFQTNGYLDKPSDLLFLQRILGSQYVMEELNNVNLIINEASIEKILNDSEQFLFINRNKGYLITPHNTLLTGKDIQGLEKISYLNVIKEFSPEQLEDALEKGILYL